MLLILILIFVTQSLFAQNDRKLPQMKNNILTEVCRFTTYSGVETCVSNYEAKNVLFNETSLAVCKDAQFALMSDKQKCVDSAKGKIFNTSYLNNCLDKGHDRKRGLMPPKIAVYVECMNDKDNLAILTEKPKSSGDR